MVALRDLTGNLIPNLCCGCAGVPRELRAGVGVCLAQGGARGGCGLHLAGAGALVRGGGVTRLAGGESKHQMLARRTDGGEATDLWLMC